MEKAKLPDYIIVSKDPRSYLPQHILQRVKIMEFSEPYYSILENANILKELFPNDLAPSASIEVVEGEYKGLAGIIDEVEGSNIHATLVIWGRPVKVTLKKHQVRRVKIPWTVD